MNRFLAIGFISALTLLGGLAAPALPTFFTRAEQNLLEQYVNPRSVDLVAWQKNLQQEALKSCPSGCDDLVLQHVLTDQVKAIGDKHFYVFDRESLRLEDQLPVGSSSYTTTLGFLLESHRDSLTVRYVHPQTPAAAYFRSGDIILEATLFDSKLDIKTFSLEQKIALAERRGIGLEIRFMRDNKTQTARLSPATGGWKPESTLLAGNTLWLRLTSTRAEAARWLHDQIREAKKNGIKKIILDLRFNFGGTPFQTINIVGAFLPKAGVILKDRNNKKIEYLYQDSKILYSNELTGQKLEDKYENPSRWDGDLVVLTSKYTFSGGENLVAVLQEAKRGLVVGEATKGAAGLTGNTFVMRFEAYVFIPQYRHYSLENVARALQVKPDVIVEFDAEAARAGRDNQLEAALK